MFWFMLIIICLCVYYVIDEIMRERQEEKIKQEKAKTKAKKTKTKKDKK